MRFNHHKFSEIATNIVLSAVYDSANPINQVETTVKEINERCEKAIYNYQNDPMTHARVDTIVAMLMQHIDECID